MTKKKPNFLIGGTSAGGTSFLSALLLQHPDIYMPRDMRPEPHYFYKSWEYERGAEYYLERWFSDIPENCSAVGERSSSYLFGGRIVAQRIADFDPEMKLIFTLRNPIERTWANYRYTALQGLEDLSFTDALRQEKQRIAAQDGIWAEIQPHNYTGRGFYAQEVKEFLDIFPREQILMIKSEDLSADTCGELNKVLTFLEVDHSNFTPKEAPQFTSVNVTDASLQKKMRDYFGDRFDKIIEATRKGEELGQFALTEYDKHKIDQLQINMKGAKEHMPDEMQKYLQDLFAHDIAELANYVDFDLKDWK